MYRVCGNGKGRTLDEGGGAKTNWASWMADPSVPRDKDGPRGFLRLWVKTRDKISLYQDVSKSQEFSKSQKLGKKASQEEIEAKIKQVFESDVQDDNDDVSSVFATSKSLQGAAMKAMAGLNTSAFDGSMTAPSLEELQDMSAKKPRRGAAPSEETPSESPGSEGPSGKALPEKSPTKAAEWLEPTRVNKVLRLYEKKVATLKQHLEDLRAKMKGTICEFQSKPEKKEYVEKLKNEMSVVVTRLRWLTAVLLDEAQPAQLKTLIKETIADGGTGAGTVSESASSRDLGLLARAGPCPGFEQLVLFKDLEAHKAAISSATTAKELSDRADAKNDVFKLFGALCSSCRTALSDLSSAHLSIEHEAKEANKAAAAERQKRKQVMPPGKASKRLGLAVPPASRL